MPRSSETELSTYTRSPLGKKLNDIFPKLNNVKYDSLVDASSRNHNFKLDDIIILHKIHMPIWQIQIQVINVWSSPFRGYVSMKNR